MDGERKLILIIVCLTLICLTILYSFLFIALWDYRQYIGLSLLALFVIGVAVFLRGKWTEQDLRVMRYRHNEETPLDEHGEPRFWREGYQPNPHRR